MMTRSPNALGAAAFASLLAAVALSLPVIERLHAAAWQWYKFDGYSEAGYITLSATTGLIFTGLAALVFAFAYAVLRAARRRALIRASAWSRWAMCVLVAAVVCYWLLGVSSLNVWR